MVDTASRINVAFCALICYPNSSVGFTCVRRKRELNSVIRFATALRLLVAPDVVAFNS